MRRERAEGLLGSQLTTEELGRLNAWFGACKLRQTDLATAIDTPPSVISKALSGDIPLNLARLRIVCRLLGHELYELFTPGPTVIEHQPDMTPAEIALEMRRLADMLLRSSAAMPPADRFVQPGAGPGLSEDEFAQAARDGALPPAAAVDTRTTAVAADTPDEAPVPPRRSAGLRRDRRGK